MKKIIFLTGIICLVFSTLSWAGSIDEITIRDSWFFTIDITGTYPDGCARDAYLSTTVLEDQIIIDIFTESFPTQYCTFAPEQPFQFSESMSPPLSECYSIIVTMYDGDETGTVLASKILQVGSSGCEMPEPKGEPVEEVLEAYVEVKPEFINIQRNAKYISAKIILPEGYMPEDINAESIKLGVTPEDGGLQAVSAEKLKIDEMTLVVKFDNKMVMGLIDETVNEYPATVTFYVQGQVWDGPSFIAIDNAKVINHGKLGKF